VSEQRANSEDLKLDIAKNQLASLLGTIPETLSRILTRMTRQGLIQVEGSRIRIVDRRGWRNWPRRRDVSRTERRETMRTSWRIFTIFGIDIRIDSSWVLIFGLVTWALARYYFPSQYPHWPQQQFWLVGLIASLLLFSSVLAHELTHSLVARSKGEEVRSITLFLFGGVAEISEEPGTPAKEFIIALAGPLSSFIIAALFFGVWHVMQGSTSPSPPSPAIYPSSTAYSPCLTWSPAFPLMGEGCSGPLSGSGQGI